jgi:hypothetical protein
MLRAIGSVVLPPHATRNGFDHACVITEADDLCVAHTANDAVEVIDLERRVHDATLPGFPGVAGVAVCPERHLLLATCRREGHVATSPLRGALTIRRITVGDRPNGLAIASSRGVALAACVGGDVGGPSMAVLDLSRGVVLASESLPGRPRWVVHDPDEGCFHVNVATPPEVLTFRDCPPFEVMRAVVMPVPGPHGLELDAVRGLLHASTHSYPGRTPLPCSPRRDRPSMVVSVVDVRQMRMVVMEPHVLVDVRVRLGHCSFVTVRVMLIVHVRVLVLGRFVNVRVRVARSHDDRCAERHQCSRDEMGSKWPLAEEGDGEYRPDERRRREVGGLARRTDGPHGEQEEDDARPVTDRSGGESSADVHC